MNIADVITAVSVAIAALAFVVGVNAWRREFVGKRRIELAENVLALFYEAQDAILERAQLENVQIMKVKKKQKYLTMPMCI